MAVTRDQLRGLIAANLFREWLDSDPGPECFDASEANMARLLWLLGGKPIEDVEAARRHVIACARCRYLYARMRELSCMPDDWRTMTAGWAI